MILDNYAIGFLAGLGAGVILGIMIGFLLGMFLSVKEDDRKSKLSYSDRMEEEDYLER